MKKLLCAIVSIFMLTAILPNSASAIDSDTDGVYQINSQQDLMDFADIINTSTSNANAKLMCDIDMAGINWVSMVSYNGIFDGNGHTISSMATTAGFITTLGANGIVKNTVFFGASAFLQSNIGSAVVACTNNGKITNCLVKSSTIQQGNYIGLGGIAGINNGEISNCAVMDTTLKRRYSGAGGPLGGICYENDGTVSGCFAYNCTYENCSPVSGGIAAMGKSAINSCYYTTSAIGSTVDGTPFTKEQFSSGEACYMLSGGIIDGTQGWYQTIGETYPAFSGKTVYQVNKYENCDKTGTPQIAYSNINEDLCHSYENGICSKCNAFEPAPQDSDGYYEIENCGNFKWFANKVNAGEGAINGRLMNDISLVGDWTPIGKSSARYSGTFDGGHHNITGLSFTVTSAYQGLFGYAQSAVIKNIAITGYNISGYTNIGAVCGYGKETTIEGCQANGTLQTTGNINNGAGNSAGICGTMENGTIKNCYAGGTIIITQPGTQKMASNIGGICGYAYKSSINGCYAQIAFDGDLDKSVRIGILRGYHYGSTAITNCAYKPLEGYNYSYNTFSDYEAYPITDFTTGEACYMLNDGVTDGSQTWYQTIGEGLPSYSGETVYQYIRNNGDVCYVNTEPEENKHIHIYDENGYCSDCGNWLPPTLNDDNYYEITTIHELEWFGKLVNGNLLDVDGMQDTGANAVLMKDIDMSGIYGEAHFKSWAPIGNENNEYTGTFDGNRHTIIGLYIDSSNPNTGLFGSTLGAEIKNINLTGCSVSGTKSVGAIIGSSEDTNVSGCTVQGSVSGTENIGGIIGYSSASNVSFSVAKGSVSGTIIVGGIVGYLLNYNGLINSCYSVASVSGAANCGMICGYNASDILNCCFSEGENGFAAVGADPSNDTLTMAVSDFSSGMACAFLNNNVSDGTQGWYQTLGEDEYPVADNTHSTVYSGYRSASCLDTEFLYSNDSSLNLTYERNHSYNENGICEICKVSYEPAVKNGEIYEIGNAGQLKWFADLCKTSPRSSAMLTSDIDLSAVCSETLGSWTPINMGSLFNGNGHKIKNLYINTSSDYQGLFGKTDRIRIYDLIIENCDITGESFVGGIVGFDTYGIFGNCYVSGSVKGIDHVGGLCGHTGNDGGNITSCCSTATVSGTEKIGGISGSIMYSTIAMSNCCYLVQGDLPDVGENLSPYRATAISDFATGEACYILNGGVVDGSQKWYQTVGVGTPMFDGKTVYKYSTGYSNSPLPETLAIAEADETSAIIEAPENITATLVFAAYSGNKLISIDIQNNKSISAGIKTYVPTEKFIANSADMVKLMLWESAENMKPLCNAVAAEKIITATFDVTEDTTATLVFAAYDKTGKLICLDMQENVTVSAGSNTLSATNKFSRTDADSVKAMLWESSANMKPLCEAVNIILK